MSLTANPLVCLCSAVTRKAILHVIKNRGARSVGDVRRLTGANTGCRKCTSKIEQLITDYSDTTCQLPIFPNE